MCFSNIPNRTEFAKQLEELFGRDVVVEVLDEEGAAAGSVNGSRREAHEAHERVDWKNSPIDFRS